MKYYNQFIEETEIVIGFASDSLLSFMVTRDWYEKTLRELANKTNKSYNTILDAKFTYGKGVPENPYDIDHQETHREKTEKLSAGGLSEKVLKNLCLANIYSYWDYYRKKEMEEKDVVIEWNIMGDLRLLRNSILHNKGRADKTDRYQVKKWFEEGQEIFISNSDMKYIFQLLRKHEDIRIISDEK